MRSCGLALLAVTLLAPASARAHRLVLLGERLGAPTRVAALLRASARAPSAGLLFAADGRSRSAQPSAGDLEFPSPEVPRLDPINPGRFVGAFVLADLAGFFAMLAGGWAAMGLSSSLGMSEYDTALLGATYGAAILGATAAMSGIAAWMFSPGDTRASFWSAWLGALVATGLTIGVGYAADAPEFDVVLGLFLPALGALIGAGMSREPDGEAVRAQPAPAWEPDEERNDDEFDEDEEQAARLAPRVLARAGPPAPPLRTPVVTVIAFRF